MRQENSVLVALRDLRAIEADRVAEERQREDDERRRREEEERTREALAEAETRNRRLDESLNDMRGQIAALAAQAKAPPPPPVSAVPLPAPEPVRRLWPLVVAMLLATIALWAALRPRERVVYVPTRLPAPVATPPLVVAPPPLVAAPPAPAPPQRHAKRSPAKLPPPPPLPSVTTCGDDPLCGVLK